MSRVPSWFHFGVYKLRQVTLNKVIGYIVSLSKFSQGEPLNTIHQVAVPSFVDVRQNVLFRALILL